jgi:hypothetical protein
MMIKSYAYVTVTYATVACTGTVQKIETPSLT